MRDHMVKIMACTRLVVYGSTGRLGTKLCSLAARDDGVQLVAAVAHQASTSLGNTISASSSDPQKTLKIQAKSRESCDVVVDTSTPQGTACAAAHAAEVNAALVVCTTGLSGQIIDQISSLSDRLPVLIAPNTSLGLEAMRRAVAQVGRALRGRSDAGVIDIHRSAKRDAPSGTARLIAQELHDLGYETPDRNVISLRVGDVVGEHTVRFELAGETIEITHRVRDVETFAHGALQAAKWIAQRKPGMYTMSDVLSENA